MGRPLVVVGRTACDVVLMAGVLAVARAPRGSVAARWIAVARRWRSALVERSRMAPGPSRPTPARAAGQTVEPTSKRADPGTRSRGSGAGCELLFRSASHAPK